MRILITGDPHLKINKFTLALAYLKWFNSHIKEQKPELVINLGDTFDTHAVVRSEILKVFMDHVLYVTKELKIPYVYVLGNHDFFRPDDSTYHALQTLKEIPNFYIVDKPKNLFNMTFIPYIPDMSKFPKKSHSICFAHQTFLGADYGFMRPEDGVLPSSVVGADIIISGHIHMRQQFDNVIYPGTPFSQSLNDLDQEKGILLFDSKTFDKKYIESDMPRWRSLKYILDPNLSMQDVHMDVVSAINNTDNWIVDVTGPKAEIVAYQDSKEFKKIQKKFLIRINPRFSDKIKRKTEIKSSSMEDIITEYWDKVYKGTIDKDVLKSKSLDIYKSNLI